MIFYKVHLILLKKKRIAFPDEHLEKNMIDASKLSIIYYDKKHHEHMVRVGRI